MEEHKSIKEYFIIFIVALGMGVIGQTIIPELSTKLNLYYFDFRFLISNIDIYPFIIVFLISFKKPEPKKAFWRIFIYFIGLCIGYYGYTSIINFYNAFAYKNVNYISNIILNLKDLFEYLFIGVLASIWGYIMLKYKNKEYLYYLMLLPFVLISIYIIYSNFTCNPPNLFMIIVDIFSLVGIIICSLNKKYPK